jgi:hypothetical protein
MMWGLTRGGGGCTFLVSGTPKWKFPINNLLEFKDARRVLVEGNLFDHSLVAYAVLCTVRAEDKKVPWAVVEDIIFRYNLIRHVGGGIDVLGNDDGSNGMGSTQRIAIENNVFEDVDGKKWDGSGWCVLMVRGATNVSIDHNTALTAGAVVFGDSAQPPASGFVFTNNIATNGIYGSGQAGGTGTLDYYFPGATVAKNAFVAAKASAYPPGNFFPANLNAVRFVDLASGDYRLELNSVYRGKGTDGKNLGADVERLEQLAGAALSGTARLLRPRSTNGPEPYGPIR